MTRERAILFGPDRSLVGVVALGQNNRPDPVPPPMIMLNAGLLHRIGPHRMYVDMARALANQGVTSLRMDFSGVGDSGPRADGLPASESVISEVQDAMNLLEQTTRQDRFVLMGLCSGADNGFRIACADRRVKGLVLIDVFPYRTFGFYLRHYGQRLLSRGSWKNLLAGRHPVWGLFRGGDSELADEYIAPRQLPPREQVASGLQTLVARGVKLLVIYTAGLVDEYNHRGQFLRTFRDVDFGDQLRLEYFSSSDHTFTLLEERQKLVELVEEWMAADGAR